MSQDKLASLPKIRTFAHDLEQERIKRGEIPAHEEKPKQVKKGKVAKHPASIPKKLTRSTKKIPHIQAEPATTLKQSSESKKATSETKSHVIEKMPEHIPAFHELQKSQKKSPAGKNAEDTINSAVAEISANPKSSSSGGAGTIITDTKKNRLKLIPSLILSFQDFLKSFNKILKKKKKRTYTVPETDRRRGVIQKATSKSGTIFTADNETLKKRIRERHAKQDKEDHEVLVSWSPYTEPGFALIETEEKLQPGKVTQEDPTQNAKVEYKKHTLPPPVTTSPQETVPVAPELYPIEPVEKQPGKVIPATEVSTESEIHKPEPQPDTPIERPSFPPEEAPQGFVGRLFRFDTNTMSVGIVISIIALVAAGFLARALYTEINSNQTPPVESAVVVEPILSGSELILAATEEKTYASFLDAVVATLPDTNTGIAELYFADQTNRPLSIEEVLAVIDLQTSNNLVRLIDSLHVGVIDRSNQIVLMRVTDDESVRGGLFQWEPFMFSDISNLVTTSENPQAFEATFIDKSISGKDVRILQSTEEEFLVYGFVEEGVVVIAGSGEDFSKIVNQN